MSRLTEHIKTQTLLSLPPDDTVAHAASAMAAANLGSVLVMEADRLVGIVTEQDILNKVVARGAAHDRVRLRDIMSSQVVTISSDKTVRDCYQMVCKVKARHLPVVSGQRVVGMVTLKDILLWLVDDIEDEKSQLIDYITT